MKPRKLPPNIRRHGAGYRAVVAVDGVRHRSPVLPTVDRAVTWLAAFRRANRPDALPEPTLADGLELILDDLAATAARPATVAFYRNHARPLLRGLGGPQTLLADIRASDLRRYVSGRLAAGVAAQTVVSKELFALRRMLRLARDAGHDLPDPFRGLRLPRFRTGRFAVLEHEQVAAILAKMRADPRAGRHADLVELIYGTGLRLSEVARLRVENVELEARRLAVDGKTGHRYQPIGEHLVPVLTRLCASARGGRLASVRTLERLFPRWQRRLQEPRFSCHVLRHSYATALAPLLSPWELMTLLGHATVTQTARYFHGRTDAVRGALDSLRPDPPATEPSA